MDIQPTFLWAVIAGIVTAIILHLYYQGKLRILAERIKQLVKIQENLQLDLENHQEVNGTLSRDNQALNQQNVLLQQQIDHIEDKMESFAKNENRLIGHFEQIAMKVLKDNSNEISALHQKDLHQLLAPLSKDIEIYRKKVEENTLEFAKDHATLTEQIHNLSRNTQLVSAQTDRLIDTLRSDYKKQGTWGEIILESILDKSGLVKDREYEVQPTLKTEEARIRRPDVIIHLPDGKKLIIDSKVSLSSFDQLMNSKDESDSKRYLKSLVVALKNHIQQLAEKKYERLYPMQSPDFVFMFIPIDNALAAALRHDAGIFDYAMERNVVVVTSSTLLATIKTVESLWRSDKQNRNAMLIADEAGKMYDKLVSIAEDFRKLGEQLKTTTRTYDQTMNKLSEGKGNLIRRAQQIKELGAKTKKVLPKGYLHKAV